MNAGGAGAVELLADAVRQYWDAAIAPYWVPDGAVSSRTTCRYRAALSLSGVARSTCSSDLHPEVTLAGAHC